MDFISGLSRTLKKYDSILFVVDRFSKMIHFIPYNKSMDASHIAYILCRDLVCSYSLPRRLFLIEMLSSQVICGELYEKNGYNA